MDSMGVGTAIIRPAEPRDQDAIARMWEALSAYHTRLDARMPQMAAGAPAAYASRLIEMRSDAHTRAFVAEVDGATVGYVLGAIVDLTPDLFEHEDVGFVADIYVEPALRRRGIARQLFDALCHWFAQQNVYRVEWQVAVANEEARRFWESVGGRDLVVRMRLWQHE
jgi:ribosomal protein S18 acetylase RimI-like enzyme